MSDLEVRLGLRSSFTSGDCSLLGAVPLVWAVYVALCAQVYFVLLVLLSAMCERRIGSACGLGGSASGRLLRDVGSGAGGSVRLS